MFICTLTHTAKSKQISDVDYMLTLAVTDLQTKWDRYRLHVCPDRWCPGSADVPAEGP